MSDKKKKTGRPKRILRIKGQTRGPNMLAKKIGQEKHLRRKAGLPDPTPLNVPELLREKE
jgi:hypothetical protein